MILLYDIVKHKTNVRGYWKDGKKLYKDNIQILKIEKNNQLQFNYAVKVLFNEKAQECIFYKMGNFAFIQDNQGNTEVLKKVMRFYYYELKPSIIKNLLKKYNGLTVFKRDKIYMIETWSA
jgi:hypothetical protein